MIKCNLAVLLAERNLKISDVVEATRISRTTLTALVYNQGKGVQFETMDTLCDYLGITPGQLFEHYRFDIKIQRYAPPEDERPKGVYILSCIFRIGDEEISGEVLCDLKDYGTDDFNESDAVLKIVIWEKLYKKLLIVPNQYIAQYFLEFYFTDVLNQKGAITFRPEFATYQNREDMFLNVDMER